MIKALEQPINVLVNSSYLHNLEPGHTDKVRGKIIALTSYPGHVLTCEVLIENKFLFSYLPFSAFGSSKGTDLDKHYYFNCPEGDFFIHVLPVNPLVQVFNKKGEPWGYGNYIMTVDWPDGNQQGHIIDGLDSQMLLWPSHKLIFNPTVEKEPLPNFKKLKWQWKLPEKK